MKSFDCIFLHPPRTFRNKSGIKRKFLNLLTSNDKDPLGPPQYALIPMGLFSLASSLIRQGYTSKIINLALNQDLNPNFDIKKYVRSLQSEIFAIDMHWFTHTASALDLASLLKKNHPNSLIVLGGITATHFHKELITGYPFVDAVLLGEAEKSIVQLVQAHLHHRDLNEVKGITYRHNGAIKYTIQEPQHNLDDLEFTQLDLLENCREYLKTDIRGFSDTLPNIIWLNIARGCPYNCIHCGGGRDAYYNFCLRKNPVFRSPEKVADDIERLCEYRIKGICFSHDPEIFGEKYWSNLLRAIRERNIQISAYIENFRPPSREFLKSLRQTFLSGLMNISPETASEEVRKFIGKDFSNDEIFRSIENIKREGFDVYVYFTIGLPGETLELTRQYEKFIDKIFSQGALVIPPLPYTVDPNCMMALYPEKYGVRLLLKDLEDYKEVCSLSSPKNWIGHETDSMKKDEILRFQSTINRHVIENYNKLSSR